jgi:hypothetical protein
MTVTRIAMSEGTEITTHQRVIDAKPVLRDLDGNAMTRRACDGVLRVQAGDRGRGPVVVECDECGHVAGLARRDPNQTPSLLVGAGVTDDDGYTRF